MNWILQSERLNFRRICAGDFDSLCEIFQDRDVMYAWEHTFTDREVWDWIEECLERYERDGFSFFAAIEKETGRLAGVIGPLIEELDTGPQMGIAYLLAKRCWHKGFAAEGAKACVEYAFSVLKAQRVIAEIRPENLPSRHVAEKLGMQIEGEFVKHYQGKEMIHLIYCRNR